jgi:hypothetical protein
MSFGIPVRNGLGLGLLASTSLATGNFGNPALYLPFALTGTLDSRITFSRPSLATMYDSTGKLTYAPNNLVLQSNALGTSPWVMSKTGVGVVPTPTNAYATYNGRNQTRLQFSLGGGTATGDISTAYQALTYVGTTIHSVMLCSTDGVSSYNMQITGADGTAQNIVVTGTPTQFFVKQTATGTVNYAVRLRGGQVPANSNTADILVWDDQIEAVTYETTPRTFNATTSAAYYGPRFDYNPATLVARGLLIEESRTNSTLYSKTNVANWTVSNTTLTADNATAPDGTTSASRLTVSASPIAIFYSTAITTTAVHWTQSFFVKAGTASWVFIRSCDNSSDSWFNVSTGVVGAAGAGCTTTITPVGNGWYRCTVAKIVSATASGFSVIGVSNGDNVTTATVGQTIFVWGAQAELGTFATSYIPTAASSVARSADSATMTGTNFSSWYNQAQGTFVITADTIISSGNGDLIMAGTSGGFDPGSVGSFGGSAGLSAYTRASSAYTANLGITGSPGVNTAFKVSIAYKTDDVAGVINGGAVATATPPNAMPTTVNDLTIMGSALTGSKWNGHIASLAYYNTRLPNATLQSLTT